MDMNLKEKLKECQFLIGNVFQLISSVSNNDITLFSVQNQSKIHKKYVDPQTDR